jgi:hypothetical protein
MTYVTQPLVGSGQNYNRLSAIRDWQRNAVNRQFNYSNAMFDAGINVDPRTGLGRKIKGQNMFQLRNDSPNGLFQQVANSASEDSFNHGFGFSGRQQQTYAEPGRAQIASKLQQLASRNLVDSQQDSADLGDKWVQAGLEANRWGIENRAYGIGKKLKKGQGRLGPR